MFNRDTDSTGVGALMFAMVCLTIATLRSLSRMPRCIFGHQHIVAEVDGASVDYCIVVGDGSGSADLHRRPGICIIAIR